MNFLPKKKVIPFPHQNSMRIITYNIYDHYLPSCKKWLGQNLTSLTACYGFDLMCNVML